jgi:hypothetical protein
VAYFLVFTYVKTFPVDHSAFAALVNGGITLGLLYAGLSTDHLALSGRGPDQLNRKYQGKTDDKNKKLFKGLHGDNPLYNFASN